MTTKQSDQHAHFLETARALECNEDEAAFDEKLKAVVGPKAKVEREIKAPRLNLRRCLPVIALLIGLQSVGAVAACHVDPSLTSADIAATSEPWSKNVPRGFKIDQHHYSFATTPSTGPVDLSTLPSDVPNQAGLKVGIGSWRTTYREKAECRVQGPDGRWWLATRDVGGDLSYVRQDLVIGVRLVRFGLKQRH